MTYTPPEGVTIGSFTAGTLPASFSAPADAVVTYKIYGTSEGAGVVTESGEPVGFKIPILCQSKIVTENLFDKNATDTNNGYVDGYHLKNDGTTGANSSWAISEYMPITGGLNYTFNYGTLSSSPAICYYDSDRHYIIGVPYGGQNPKVVSVPQNASYIRFSFMKSYVDDIMFVQGTSLPDHYIPHFYQSNYDLFIGDTKLGEYEYVDFTTQKIYKMQEGELLPTDPPLPLPSIITYDEENTISSTETLGDVELTGDWLAIMGSTEDESIDIGFTVDAEEYIAFVTVDDGPSIQVSDTIIIPSSADSFTLEVVSWGREQYTDTVYNALS